MLDRAPDKRIRLGWPSNPEPISDPEDTTLIDWSMDALARGATMKLLGLTLLFAQVVGGEDIYQDFRQGFVPAVFQPEGRDATRWIKTEPEGIRITLPPGSNVASAVGMRLQGPIQGDFEITTGYEIIQIDVPTAGFGAG